WSRKYPATVASESNDSALAAIRSHCPTVTLRTTRFSAGIDAAVIDSVRSPSPISSSANSGSPAVSPQHDTGTFRRRATRPTSSLLLYQPLHRRVRRAEQIGHPLVRPIHRQRVLHQVVGPDRKEIDLARERIGHQRRRRHLHHHPHFDLAVELDPLLQQILHH